MAKKSTTMNCRTKKLTSKKKKLEKKLQEIMQVLKKNERNNLSDKESTPGRTQQRRTHHQDFANIRDKHFQMLHEEVIQNMNLNPAFRSCNEIEAITLQIEQRALLACMQSSIYEDFMTEMIQDVQCASKSKQLHPLVSAAAIPIIKTENNPKVTTTVTTSFSSDTPYPMDLNPTLPTPTVIPSYPLVATVTPTAALSPAELPKASPERTSKPVSWVQPRSKIISEIEKNISSREGVEPGLTDFISHCKVQEPSNDEDNHLGGDTSIAGNDYVDEGLDHEDDFNIDNLMHILEGTEHLNVDTRLEQMRDLFEANIDAVEKKVKNSPPTEQPVVSSHHPSHSSTIKVWKNERYIFMYKVVSRCARMTAPKFFHTRKVFAQLFGDDSDYEHEDHFSDSETFLSSCSRRILPDVAKYVMPYYKQRRICGGSYIFKNLVRRIADSLVDFNDYPSENDIKLYVEKYFPAGKKYMDVNDVWCYCVD